jgi:hypothetical protein
MNAGMLFVSLWNLCLENLPEGDFRRRRITADEAKRLLDQARREKRLLCVSKDDLLACDKDWERLCHDEFRAALKKHCGIALSFKDFTMADESDGKSYSSITPLVCVEIKDEDRLLIATCGYAMDRKRSRDALTFSINPASLNFHLIEAMTARTQSVEKPTIRRVQEAVKPDRRRRG